MKIFIYVLLAIAVGLIAFNITLLDFSNLLEGDSLIALIGIIASLCAVCILVIFRMAKSIDEKNEKQPVDV
jgi:type VI protein secretion system component VasK